MQCACLVMTTGDLLPRSRGESPTAIVARLTTASAWNTPKAALDATTAPPHSRAPVQGRRRFRSFGGWVSLWAAGEQRHQQLVLRPQPERVYSRQPVPSPQGSSDMRRSVKPRYPRSRLTGLQARRPLASPPERASRRGLWRPESDTLGAHIDRVPPRQHASVPNGSASPVERRFCRQAGPPLDTGLSPSPLPKYMRWMTKTCALENLKMEWLAPLRRAVPARC